MPFEFIQITANGQRPAKEALYELLRGGRIASVRKEFVANAENLVWALCIEFLDGVSSADKCRSGPKVDYKVVLSEADFAVFANLRDLRKRRSDKQAILAYSIFTHEQLAAMVTEKAGTLAALGMIPEVETARAEKYGANFLTMGREIQKFVPEKLGMALKHPLCRRVLA